LTPLELQSGQIHAMKHLLVAIISVLMLVGCCYEVDCEQDNLNFGLVSFLQTDIDTIVFRKYGANSNFQSLKDTMQITNINVLTPAVSGDTVLFLTSSTPSTNIKFQLVAGNDYEIFIPGVNKLTRITEILEQKTKRKNCDISDGNKTCYNPIISFRVDRQLQTSEPIYIRK
jgi:hypothetical protein